MVSPSRTIFYMESIVDAYNTRPPYVKISHDTRITQVIRSSVNSCCMQVTGNDCNREIIPPYTKAMTITKNKMLIKPDQTLITIELSDLDLDQKFGDDDYSSLLNYIVEGSVKWYKEGLRDVSQ